MVKGGISNRHRHSGHNFEVIWSSGLAAFIAIDTNIYPDLAGNLFVFVTLVNRVEVMVDRFVLDSSESII